MEEGWWYAEVRSQQLATNHGLALSPKAAREVGLVPPEPPPEVDYEPFAAHSGRPGDDPVSGTYRVGPPLPERSAVHQ